MAEVITLAEVPRSWCSSAAHPLRHEIHGRRRFKSGTPGAPLLLASEVKDMTNWKPVAGFEQHYEVSSRGQVYSIRSRRILKPGDDSRGYLFVNLSVGGMVRSKKVHRLVAEAFLPPPEMPGMEVCHGNGFKTDNRAVNLRWGSRSVNNQDRVTHGTHPNASKTHCPQSHEYSSENTYRDKKNRRYCRTCQRERNSIRNQH